MILSILLVLFSSHFSQEKLEWELSCDTYPYGADPSPVIKTINGSNPRIDSMNTEGIFGTINGKDFHWNPTGICQCYDLFYNYEPRRD